MTTSEILNLVVPALITTVLIPFIATAISALTNYLRTKANNAKLDKYFDMANDAVTTAVAEIMQTFVTELKDSGTWDAEAAKHAFELAKNRAIEIMGVAALQALPEIVGDIDAWIKAKIEAATLSAKWMTAC